jgi:hypothetical protein
MADAVTSQPLMVGSHNAVMKFTNDSDGTGESKVLKIDASALEFTSPKITRIWYSTHGLAIRLYFDATADVVALVLGKDEAGYFDFRDFGGIPNNSGSGSTGDILLSTSGAVSGEGYTIIIEVEST